MRTLCSGIFLFFSFCSPTLAQTADFKYNSASNLFCSPVAINFIETCTGSPNSFLWNFGGIVQIEGAKASFTFTAAGTYPVTLTAIYANTALVVTKNIVIYSVTPIKVLASENVICTPGIINFKVTGGSNIIAYKWNMGDNAGHDSAGTFSADNIITSIDSLAYDFQNFGSYMVVVNAIESSGCPARDSVFVEVKGLVVEVFDTPHSGCVPAHEQFIANVKLPPGDSVSNYQWNFGDGSALVNSLNNNIMIHSYNSRGSYVPILSVSTVNGCSAIDTLPKLHFGIPPLGLTAHAEEDTVCGSDSIKISYRASTANSFGLIWGDGVTDYVSASGNNQHAHKYTTIGSKPITVTPYDNGCAGPDVSFNVFIKGVIASFSFAQDCANDSIFNFSTANQGRVTSIIWRFGDGVMLGNNNNPVHKYAYSGADTVRMVITDSFATCWDSAFKILYINNPSLAGSQSSVCRGATATFDLVNGIANPALNYVWNIAGKIYTPYDSSSLTIAADSVGIFNNYVIISGKGYCVDTIKEKDPFKVNGALAQFSIPDSVCQNSSIQAVNISPRISGNDTVKQWQWNFNGALLSSNTYQPPPYTFSTAGTFNISLSSTDQYGCSDTLVKPVTVNGLPFVQTLSSTEAACQGQAKTLIAFNSGILSWSPAGQVSCVSCDTTLAYTTTPTTFIATATSSFGCVAKDTDLVTVITPFKAVPLFSDTSVCLNTPLQLSVSPAGKKALWSPSAGLSADNIYDPIATPAQTTLYQVILSDPAGCFSDTAQLNVHINSLPTVNAGPNAVYPYHSGFSFQPTYSTNVTSYEWSPATSLSCSNCAVPQGTADNYQTYTVKVTSDSGCVATDSVTISITCANSDLLLPTAFTPNNDGLNDIYYPIGRGIKIIKKFLIYNREGQLVFEKDNFPPNQTSCGWNGKINSYDQPSGTYVYLIESICDEGEDINQKGTFVLIR